MKNSGFLAVYVSHYLWILAADKDPDLHTKMVYVRHAWGLLASLQWGSTLPQGRCGRWLLAWYPTNADYMWRRQRWLV